MCRKVSRHQEEKNEGNEWREQEEATDSALLYKAANRLQTSRH